MVSARQSMDTSKTEQNRLPSAHLDAILAVISLHAIPALITGFSAASCAFLPAMIPIVSIAAMWRSVMLACPNLRSSTVLVREFAMISAVICAKVQPMSVKSVFLVIYSMVQSAILSAWIKTVSNAQDLSMCAKHATARLFYPGENARSYVEME